MPGILPQDAADATHVGLDIDGPLTMRHGKPMGTKVHSSRVQPIISIRCPLEQSVPIPVSAVKLKRNLRSGVIQLIGPLRGIDHS